MSSSSGYFCRMKSSVSVNLITRLHSNLDESATKIAERCAPEDLHTFRVNFKKLRAFIRFLNHTSERQNEVVLSDDLKLCYQHLGNLRDWQLLQQKLLEGRCKEDDINLVKDQISHLTITVHQLQIRDIVVLSQEQLLKHRFHTCHILEAELYLDHKWELLKEIAGMALITADQLHQFRKILKDIFYSAGLLKSAKIPLFAEGMLPGRPAAYFDSLLTALGDFNDVCTQIRLLDSVDSYSFGLHLLSDEWKEKKLNIVKDIATTISEVMLQRDYYQLSSL